MRLGRPGGASWLAAGGRCSAAAARLPQLGAMGASCFRSTPLQTVHKRQASHEGHHVSRQSERRLPQTPRRHRRRNAHNGAPSPPATLASPLQCSLERIGCYCDHERPQVRRNRGRGPALPPFPRTPKSLPPAVFLHAISFPCSFRLFPRACSTQSRCCSLWPQPTRRPTQPGTPTLEARGPAHH